MGKKIDLTGQRFGKWTVLRSGENDKWGGRRWLCECDCGTVKEVADKSLKIGRSSSCGCSNKKDLSGRKFGKLKVIGLNDGRKGGCQLWKAMCDCGKIIEVGTTSLLNGHTGSCGCSRILDLTGQRFGRLTVLKLSNRESENSRVFWECICECGTKKSISSSALRQGRTQSCGCLHSEIMRATGGENHPRYNPNLTNEERFLNRYQLHGKNIRSWRNEVYSEDNFKCQICNNLGNNLNAHHLNAWNAFPEQRFDTANGITLCEDCHKEFHFFHGQGGTTVGDFRDHIANFIGEEHISEIEETLLSRESEIIGQEQEQPTRELQTT